MIIRNHISITEWKIKILDFYGEKIVEISPPSLNRTVDKIYSELISSCIGKWKYSILCQYINNFEWNEKKSKMYYELSKEFDLDYRIVKSFDNIKPPENQKKDQAIIVLGERGTGWIEKIIRYGGASLPNIFYGLSNIEQNWSSIVMDWNHIFQKWYWLESDPHEIVQIFDQVNLIGWTSDASINFYVKNDVVKEIISTIEKIAQKVNILPIVKNDEDDMNRL